MTMKRNNLEKKKKSTVNNTYTFFLFISKIYSENNHLPVHLSMNDSLQWKETLLAGTKFKEDSQ